MDILIFIFIILYLVLAIIRLDWAVMFILAALPSYLIRFMIFGIPFTLLEAMILISFAVWFIFHTEFKNFIRGKYSWRQFRENRKKRVKYPFGWEIILLLIISFMAAAVAGFSDSSLGIWKAYFFEPVLLFVLTLNVFVRKEDTNIRMDANDTNNTNDANLEKILWALAISALAVSALAIYQKFTGAWIFNEFWASAATRRVTSFFGYPNAVGLYLGPLILVMLGWLFNQTSSYIKRGLKIFNFQFSIFQPRADQPLAGNKFFSQGLTSLWLAINFQTLKLFFVFATIILSFLAIYFAKSKGALIGVAAGLGIFFLLAVGKKIRWAIIFLILIAAAGMLAYAPLRGFALEKTLYSKSLQIREQQWEETWNMLKGGQLISGAGLANYQKTVAPYHQEGIFLRDYNDPDWHKKTVFNAEYRAKVWQPTEIYLYPHNIFLNFWTELGLAGMLLFIWIIAKYFYIGIENWKLPAPLRLARPGKIENLGAQKNKYLIIGLIGAMTVVIAQGLVDVPYFKNDLAVMFWVLVALVSLADTNIRMNANDTNKY